MTTNNNGAVGKLLMKRKSLYLSTMHVMTNFAGTGKFKGGDDDIGAK